MPKRCPVCGEPYERVLRGEKVTIPVGSHLTAVVASASGTFTISKEGCERL